MVWRVVTCQTEALLTKDASMAQKPVITVEDITNIALEERRPGCEKGVLHEDAPVQTAVYRSSPAAAFRRTCIRGSTIFSSA